MNWKGVGVWLFIVIGTVGTAVAQNPFVGTWKLNQAKSHLTGDTIRFTAAADQSIAIATGGTSYTFRLNGSNFKMASGNSASWKQTSPSSWTTEYHRPDGKPLDTDTWKLSPDYRTLTVVTMGTKPNGEHFTDSSTYNRTAGTTGLIGTWKSIDVKLGAPNEWTIASYGIGGLSIKLDAEKATLLAGFDGKDVAPQGPNIPPGFTLALFRIGPSSFRMVQKINGHVTYSSRFTVSADATTMTEIGNAVGDPSQTMIWEKQ